MRCFLIGILLVASSGFGQSAAAGPDPTVVFQRSRARLVADAQRMPRYTCQQNIVRHFYRATSSDSQSCASILSAREKRKHDPPVTSWDRLQLDVAVADDKEIHSWPDAPRFNEEEIRKLVNNGPFGSGDFRNFITAIFGGWATIKFAAPRVVKGRTVFEYSFSVSENNSRYEIIAPPEHVITGYAGSFLLDPQTSDLIQLDVHTAELPESTSACQAISKIQYGRMDIHGHQVLIPNETDLRMVYRSGREAVAATSYTSCHEYTSRSTLRFDTSGVADTTSTLQRSEVAARNSQANPLPAGLALNCRIVTPLDSDTPAGRPIEAILRSPLRNRDKVILAPKGARIRGRLVGLADHKSSLDYFEVGIRLESIELNGVETPLSATLADQPLPPVNPFTRDGRGVQADQVADFPTAPPRNVGIFFFVRENLRLRQIDSEWITTLAEPEKSNQNESPDGRQRLAESEVRKLVLAIKYSQQAIDLQNSAPSPAPGSFCDFPNLRDIMAYRLKAIETGRSVSTEGLNNFYSGLGDKFKDEFLGSLSLFVQGCATQSQFDGLMGREVGQSRVLALEWADWYDAHRKDIQDTLNLRRLNSEWTRNTISPASLDSSP